MIPSNPSTNLEIHNYYQDEPRFNGVCSTDNLPKRISDGTYVINSIYLQTKCLGQKRDRATSSKLQLPRH